MGENLPKDKVMVLHYVTKNLRQAILDGTLTRGERLIQEEWAMKLNVSRMPVREALRQLQMEGLVKIEPHKGAVVTPITTEDIEEIYYIRSILEGVAVEKSLPHLTKEDKREIESLLVEMENLDFTEDTNDLYIHLNDRFHKKLSEGCPWSRVRNMVETFGILPIAPSILIDYYEETQKEHRLIYEAVMRNDAAELRAVTEYHIFRTKNNLISYMEQLKNAKNDVELTSK
ncbi:GntR family transcriptional regulator [Bacillus massiliigorillae]|uniref:GntR family transcriptional regulator n=1 Tax=Bacillus massiliigorillae TaxID=1243664 RepID=UPI00039B8F40|nr:GntR family transcriptional regulator [Bacillus massiliigorillae]